MPGKQHIKGAPPDVNRYYADCRKKQPAKSKEYCARVAWQVFCSHKDPDYPGCTQFGKTRGPPYSGPLSDGRIRSRALVLLERWEEW